MTQLEDNLTRTGTLSASKVKTWVEQQFTRWKYCVVRKSQYYETLVLRRMFVCVHKQFVSTDCQLNVIAKLLRTLPGIPSHHTPVLPFREQVDQFSTCIMYKLLEVAVCSLQQLVGLVPSLPFVLLCCIYRVIRQTHQVAQLIFNI